MKLKIPQPKNKWEAFWLDVGSVAGILFVVIFFTPSLLLIQISETLTGWIALLPICGIAVYGIIAIILIKPFTRMLIKISTALVYDQKTRAELNASNSDKESKGDSQ